MVYTYIHWHKPRPEEVLYNTTFREALSVDTIWMDWQKIQLSEYSYRGSSSNEEMSDPHPRALTVLYSNLNVQALTQYKYMHNIKAWNNDNI